MGHTSFRFVVLFAILTSSLVASADQGTADGIAADDALRPIDGIEVEVVPPEAQLTVGDPIPITITFSVPAAIVFDSVDFRDAGHLQFLNRQIEETTREDGGIDFRAVINLVSYRPGTHRIDHLVVGLLGPDGVVRDRVVPGFEIRVVGLLANESDPELRGEKAGVTVQYWDHTLAWAFGIGGGALLMVLLGFLVAYTRPRPAIEIPLPPPRPAHEVALEKLDQIRADQLVEEGRHMEYYIRLSETVREYLGRRYGFDGLDMTTSEIHQRMSRVKLPSSLGPEFLSHLLYECDLVKFAKYAPVGTSQTAALQSAYRLVYETTDELDREQGPHDLGRAADTIAPTQLAALALERRHGGDEPAENGGQR